jgi:uncharacterized phage protein (TIGR02218 family)
MSRTVPAGLATRLATGSSSVFFVVDITRTDGVEHKLSEADVTWNDYEPTAGLQIGTIPYGIDGYSSGVDLVLPVSDTIDAVITPADVRAGAFDAATIVITEADMTLPEAGGVEIFWGKIGNQERTTEGKLKLSAKGILSQSHQIVVERYTPMCAWFFCDTRCGLDPEDFTHTGTISAIPDRYTLTITWDGSAPADDVLKDGVMTVTSGTRINWRVEGRGNTGTTFLTFLAHPSGLEVGDEVSVLQGCQKRKVDCQAYNNILRFGGQPHAGSSEEAQAIVYREWST